MAAQDSMAELIDRVGLARVQRMARIIDPQSRSEFAETIYEALDEIFSRLVEQRGNYQRDSTPRTGALKKHEDRLTDQIALLLRQRDFDARREEDHCAHCDLVVRALSKHYTWHGESKVHNAYEHLEEGMRQLLTRYANGVDEHAGFLVFIYNKGAAHVVSTWRDRIEAATDEDIKPNRVLDGSSPADSRVRIFRFRTLHHHEGTGLNIEVRHMGVPLFLNPSDRSARSRGGARTKTAASPS